MQRQSGFIEVAVIGSFVLLLAAITFIYWFIAQPYRMSGNSQIPTLVNGEYLMVNKLDRNFQRGDIIVYRNPADYDQDFLKRIVAIPGDKIKISQGKLYINGNETFESYLKEQNKTNPGKQVIADQEIEIPADAYFVMGDNREFSLDSRDHGSIKKGCLSLFPIH
jgi:signal peptidase I